MCFLSIVVLLEQIAGTSIQGTPSPFGDATLEKAQQMLREMRNRNFGQDLIKAEKEKKEAQQCKSIMIICFCSKILGWSRWGTFLPHLKMLCVSLHWSNGGAVNFVELSLNSCGANCCKEAVGLMAYQILPEIKEDRVVSLRNRNTDVRVQNAVKSLVMKIAPALGQCQRCPHTRCQAEWTLNSAATAASSCPQC